MERVLNSHFRTVFLFTVLFFVVGCATHQAHNSSTLSGITPNSGERIEHQGFELIAKPILSKDEHEIYFDNDLIKQGILPVQLYVKNLESDESFSFQADNVQVFDNDGSRKPSMNVDQIVKQTKKSYWRTAGWTLAFGVFGAIPSAINVSKTNEKIRNSYNEKIIKDNQLHKNVAAEGLGFFAIPKDTESIDGWEISMVLKNNSSSNDITLKYQLEGKIPERKDTNADTNTPISS